MNKVFPYSEWLNQDLNKPYIISLSLQIMHLEQWLFKITIQFWAMRSDVLFNFLIIDFNKKNYQENVKFYSLTSWEGLVGAVGKISAFRPQGPQFDPLLCRNLNICVTFFST